MKSQPMDAYRYFFPVGWALGIWGVLLWILFPWNLVTYPGLHHPDIMIGGFFLCFVCGFLMTAAPKFTSSFGPTRFEQNFSFALIGILVVSLFPARKVYFFAAVITVFIFLMIFMLRRFFNRQSNPPDAFLFVGFGLMSGLLGTVILFLNEVFNVPSEVVYFGRLLFLQGYILCLVLGVGSRLIPALLGRAPLPTEMGKADPKILLFASLAAVFVAGFAVEAFYLYWIGQLMRAVVISFIAFKFWRLHQLPSRRAYQSWWLWISAYLVLISQWGLVFLPTYRIHILHVLLVSGLGLMTLMIATRVTLSHGKHNMQIEKNSKALWAGAFLIALAGATRASSGIAAHIYQSHLIYASYLWIAGLAVWGWVFIPKLFKTNEL